MTKEEAKRLVRHMAYKPGSSISALEVMGKEQECLRIQILQRLPNVKDPTHATTIIFNSEPFHPREMDESGLTALVLKCLRSMEQHETDEWFRLNGECVTDPHPELSHHRSLVDVLTVRKPFNTLSDRQSWSEFMERRVK